MDLENCKKRGLVKEVNVDLNRMKSLLKVAKNKEKASDILPEEFLESKISLLYDALRMILEYLALKENIKIYNHECYVSFLKEVLNESRLGDKFDDFRKIRNSINYYGKELDNDEAREILLQMKDFIKKIKMRK